MPDGQSQGNIFIDRQGIQKVKILEHKAKLLPAEFIQGIAPKLCDVLPSHLDFTACYPVYGGNAV